MNVIHKLTLRHLKLNKSRTLVTIIGVILSVTMLTAVTSIVSSAQDMFIRGTIASDGNWHAAFYDVPAEKIDVFHESDELKEVMLSSPLGYAPLEGSTDSYKPYLFVHQYDQASLDNLGLNLVEGRLPQTPDEIIISEHSIYSGGVDISVGDTITLPLGNRYAGDKEYQLSQGDSYIPEDEGGEVFVPDQTREFTVTGIVQRPSSESLSAPGFSVFTVLDDLATASTLDVHVQFTNISQALYAESEILAEMAGIENFADQVDYNTELLGLHGVSNNPLGNRILNALLTMAAIAIAIIMVGSISLIYNAFAISLSERSRHLGMLASVGATRGQKRSSVFFEGLVVALISIPVGLLAGTGGIGVTFAAINPLLEGVINTDAGFRLVVSPISIMAAVAFSLLTIFISTWIPSRRAAKISPIDAIRQTEDIQLRGKKVRTSRLTRRLFGFEAELGLKNLKRNRRRYRATVISLAISIVLYLTVAAFTSYMLFGGGMASDDINFDLEVGVDNLSFEEKWEFYQQVTKLKQVDSYSIEQTIQGEIWLDAGMASNYTIERTTPRDNQYHYRVTVKSLDDAALAKFSQKNDIEIGSSSQPAAILLNSARVRDYAEKKIVETNIIKAQVGDVLTIDHGPQGTGQIEIGAITDQVPMGTTRMYKTQDIELIVSETEFAAYRELLTEPAENAFVYLTSSEPESLEAEIRELHLANFGGNLVVNNYAQAVQNQRNILTLLTVFTTGFIVLITGICIVNIMNTISTSIALRRREFAMMKSVGLTPRGLKRILRYESIFYGLKALAFGLPLSLAINYLLYQSMGGAFEFAFTIPWANYLVAIFAVFAVVFVTMLYSSAKVKKENIIDSLKDENM